MNSVIQPEFRIVVLASGRGTNLQAIIDASESGRLLGKVVALVSDSPDAVALERARRHGIPQVVVDRKSYASKNEFDLGLLEAVRRLSPDLVVLAGFMRLLGRSFLERFPGKVINIHPSLLPAFKGLQAQKQALDYGVKYAGCTVHFVDEGVDTGPIIGQRVVPVLPDDTEDTLAARILVEEHSLLVECINAVLSGRVRTDGRKVTIDGG
ncbi:MAG: phosphoribosylglycinamide formyltransferase [Bacillota bacterium]|jgi:phosphoribosylglycinamide formyltransferase-1|nr:phosphoribosylglycinamide formyltransferase [Bacillota bacterium]MDI9415997.1 phosphoribosylglycinamide formyltransferase [Bacillota bacterium]NLD13287.1 phosphoribosylglycinamide formyltransferase [Bacillota bacterium]HCD42036.1 phosphoribosylglycinamide formyltransferase [Bacillota bacterium]HOB88530.1 phosphoribosylglycinamide formyltransferase [Bacillota bacterium]